MAASRSFDGAKPVLLISDSCESFQLLFVTRNEPGPCNSSVGSASNVAAGNPNFVKDGPIPRMSTCFGMLPVMINPPIPELSPVSVRMRVERLTAWVGGVGVAVGVAVAVAVGATVAVAVAVGATVAVAVAVAVALAVAVAVGVDVAVAVAVAVAVGVGVAVAVAVAVGVGLTFPFGAHVLGRRTLETAISSR